MKVIIFFLFVTFSFTMISCDKLDINRDSNGYGALKAQEQNDLFAISSSSSQKIKLETYFSFNLEYKSCSDGTPYTDLVSSVILIYGQTNPENNVVTVSRDTINKTLIKGSSCTDEGWVPDTSQYSIYEPKPKETYPVGMYDHFTLESIEFANRSFLLVNPEILVKLREVYSTSTNGVGTDYFYLGPYANQVVQGALFRFLSDFFIGDNTMSDLLLTTKNQFGFNSAKDLAFTRGYGYKFEPYPYDPSYPLDLMSVIKYYSVAAEMNLY
ncbi:hypothetical protein [Sphingobacterium sp.]|uniref:hypothetical protein n=1 Tax=Sphingobacterium sp. TaxID=341027 RepID=UPI0028986CD0|nr:hypothetical protein [Sphingobacterium sp.]